MVYEVYIGSPCPSSIYTWAYGTEEAYKYAHTFTEGKARMRWNIKGLVQGI